MYIDTCICGIAYHSILTNASVLVCKYVCMYVHVQYVYNICTCTCMHYAMYMCIYMYVSTCTYIYFNQLLL